MPIQFYDYLDTYQALRTVCPRGYGMPTRAELYDRLVRNAFESRDNMTQIAMESERVWNEDRRPYYKVYPGVLGMLTRLNISQVRVCDLKPPGGMRSLLVRLPEGNRILGDIDVRLMMVSYGVSSARADNHPDGERPVVSFAWNYGETYPAPALPGVTAQVPMWDMAFCRVDDTLSLEQWIAQTVVGDNPIVSAVGRRNIDREAASRVFRLLGTLCLLDESPDLLRPEVLRADEAKLTPETLERLLAKARRRGKVGWSLGADMEQVPHFRRPHPALYWTGRGREVPVVRMRPGVVVHREKVEKLPTGYQVAEALQREGQNDGSDSGTAPAGGQSGLLGEDAAAELRPRDTDAAERSTE